MGGATSLILDFRSRLQLIIVVTYVTILGKMEFCSDSVLHINRSPLTSDAC